MSLNSVLQNSSNPFYNILFRGTDKENHMIDFRGDEIPYKNSSGGIFYEEIEKTLFARLFLKNELHYYRKESSCSNGGRIDMESVVNGLTTNIIEFKHLDSNTKINNLEKTRNSVFEGQLKFYIDGRELMNECFATFVAMDIDKICSNYKLLNEYKTLTREEKANLNTLKKYGIYVEVRKYNKDKNCYSDDVWNSIPNHMVAKLKTQSWDIIPVVKIYTSVKDAISLPTSSPDVDSIKNVREVKDITCPEKRALVMDILETVLIACENKDRKMITCSGKVKDIIIDLNDSIVMSNSLYSNSSENGSDIKADITIASTNGSVVDGQNSIDGFNIILTTIIKMINNKPLTEMIELEIENRIGKHLNGSTLSELEKMYDFIITSDIEINIDTTQNLEEANSRIVSKNNSMPVLSIEKSVGNNSSIVHHVANLLQKKDIYLELPKREVMIMTKDIEERSIGFSKFSSIMRASGNFNSLKPDEIRERNFLREMRALSKENISKKKMDKFIHDLVDEIPFKNERTEELSKEIQGHENSIESNIKYLGTKLSPYCNLNEVNEANEILKEEIGLKELLLKRIRQNNYSFETNNKIINNITQNINLFFMIRSYIKARYPEKMDNIIYEFFQTKDILIDSIYYLVFVLYNAKKRKNITEHNIEFMLDRLIINMTFMKQHFNVSMTTLRNENDSEGKINHEYSGDIKDLEYYGFSDYKVQHSDVRGILIYGIV